MVSSAGKRRNNDAARPGRARVVLFGLVLIIGAAAAFFSWRMLVDQPSDSHIDELLQAPEQTVDEATVARIEAFCGDCHAVPLPGSFPRDAWHTEVRAGYEFYSKSGRTDLDAPHISQTVAYYRSQAPKMLTFPVPEESNRRLGVSFEVEEFGAGPVDAIVPAVSHLLWGKLDLAAEPLLVLSDMRRGSVTTMDVRDTGRPPRLLAQLKNPCHAEICDLDGNGTIDLVVSDLGSFPPSDHDRGRVIWLSRRADSEIYDPFVIASGIGRVADARPADFDNDGDLDVIVAVFGMDRTGQIMLLRNITADGQTMTASSFAAETIDPRPGTIHVPPFDINGDGYVDFAALISQEHEQVALFINRQGVDLVDASFQLQTVWEGPDLTFGSSGMELVDLDMDGDIDILTTNGDAFDNGFVNPRHGVQWLENQGELKFTCHRLTDLTGAYAARAGDFDLDGDRDIIAVAWLPKNAEPKNVYDRPVASVVFLEQVAPGQFERHTLERNAAVHAALEMADFDGDGDLDFVVGFYSMSGENRLPYTVAVWWNQIKKRRQIGRLLIVLPNARCGACTVQVVSPLAFRIASAVGTDVSLDPLHTRTFSGNTPISRNL